MIDIDVVDGRRLVFIEKGDITHKFLLWLDSRDLMTKLIGDEDRGYYPFNEIKREFPEPFVNQTSIEFMVWLKILKSEWRWEKQNGKNMAVYFGLTDFGSDILKALEEDNEFEIWIDDDPNSLKKKMAQSRV